MRNRFLYAVLLVFLFAIPAAAQLAGTDTLPGDSCAGFPAGAARLTADADQDGAAITLICDGTTWNAQAAAAASPDRGLQFNSGGNLAAAANLVFSSAGNLGVSTATPKAPLHVGGEAIIGPTTGLACDSNRTGGLRWSSVNSTIEMCDGTSWRKISATSVAADCTPNAFSFTDVTNVPLSILTTSNSLNITGIDPGCAVSVTGGGGPQISVNGGAWTSSTAINPGDVLQVRLTSSASYNTALVAAVAVGTSTDNWSVTTKNSNTRIFQTSATYTGSLGGLIGADSACQTAAAALGYGSYWRAVLSDSFVSAKDRLAITYPVVKASSPATTVAAANLWNGSLSNAIGGAGDAWTGSDADGTPTTENFGQWCQDWTSGSNSYVAMRGWPSVTNGGWLYNGNGANCNNGYYLYCIEQPDPGCSPSGATTFTDATNAARSTQVSSNTITPTGCGLSSTVMVVGSTGTGAQVSINGGAWGTSGTLPAGGTLQLRMTTGANYGYGYKMRVYIGNTVTTWTATTVAGGHRIFATGGIYNGSLGGFTGADTTCANEASTAGYGGYWRAILSDSLVDARDRFPAITYPVVRASDGAVIAATDLWSGSIATALAGTGTSVWTGSTSSGTKWNDWAGNNCAGNANCFCNDWTSGTASYHAQYGLENWANSQWLRQDVQWCNTSRRLYCLEQANPGCSPSGATTFTDATNAARSTQVTSNTIIPLGCAASSTVMVVGSTGTNAQVSINGGAWGTSGTLPVGGTLQVRLTTGANYSTGYKMQVYIGNAVTTWTATTVAGGTKLFVTSTTYNGNLGGLTGADSTCQSEAAALGYSGTWKAILSSDATNAKDRLTITYPVVRASDGTLIDSVNIWDGSLQAQTVPVGGTYVVWSGSNSDGTIKTGLTCTGWTSTSGSGRNGNEFYYNNALWIDDNSAACSTGGRLICVSQ